MRQLKAFVSSNRFSFPIRIQSSDLKGEAVESGI